MGIEEIQKKLGLLDENEENLQRNEDIDELINLLNTSDEEIINLENKSSEFEGLSQEELNLLMEQDSNIEIEDIDTDIIEDISSYDTKTTNEEKILKELEKQEEEEEQQEQEQEMAQEDEEISLEDFKKLVEDTKSKKIKLDKSTIIIFSSVLFLSLLIIITLIFFIVTINNVNKINVQKEIERDTLIAQYKPENLNTMYFDMAKEIDGETLILEKAHIDSLNTTFYFKNKIDFNKYNIVLTDKDEDIYLMDLNFHKGKEEDNNILRFEPIDLSKKGYVLSFESLETGDKIKFDLEFNIKVEKDEVGYINSPIKNNFGDYDVSINYSEFSNLFSRIDYTIEPNKNMSYKIQQGDIIEKEYIKLKQNDKYIQPLSDKPLTTYIDNKIIGRVDFQNLDESKEDIIVEFKDIYKKYDVNKIIPLDAAKNGNIFYEFDNYKIFIEGMPKFDDTYVLVLSAKDKTISTQNRPDDFNNVEVKLNVEMVGEGANNVQVIIAPTEIKSAQYGTDIVFKLDKQQANLINSIPQEKLALNIKSVLIKQKNVSIPINLKRSMVRKIISHEIVEEQIKEAFISRLSNKPIGFSDEVLNDEKLIKEYENLPKGKHKNSIRIISKDIERNNIEAIVQEGIQIKEDNLNVLYKFHKIKAKNVDDRWVIYYDEVIK